MSEEEKPQEAETPPETEASAEVTTADAPHTTEPVSESAPTPSATDEPPLPPPPMKLSDLDEDWNEPVAPPASSDALDGGGSLGLGGGGGGSGDDSDDDGDTRASWLGLSQRGKLILIGSCTGAVFIAVMVVLSMLNARDYYLECRTSKVVAMKGSSFPWGKTELSGSKWKAIKIPPESVCSSKTFATAGELEEAFVGVLLLEAASRVRSADVEEINLAERQLQQALLLTRQLPAKRDDIERLQGDVEYWRAASEINLALTRLEAAAARFETAAKKKPRHKTDANQWARYTKETAQELRKGPPELRHDKQFGPDAPPPFAGTDTAPALPTTSTAPGPTFTGTGPSQDAGVPTSPGGALPYAADAAPPPIDAALPTGGVLL